MNSQGCKGSSDNEDSDKPVQADLSLCWMHMSEFKFSQVATLIMIRNLFVDIFYMEINIVNLLLILESCCPWPFPLFCVLPCYMYWWSRWQSMIVFQMVSPFLEQPICQPIKFLDRSTIMGQSIFQPIRFTQQPITKTRLFKYIENFTTKKKENFQIKTSDIFHIPVQNIYCGYSLEPPWWGGSNEYPQSRFWAEIRKIMYTPVNQFYYIKVGFKGVSII